MELSQERPLERSAVLPHFSPVGSDGTCYRATLLIFCFKSQAKPVGLTEEKVKLARAWYSTTVSSSSGGIQHSSARSQRHCSQTVTLVLHPTPLLHSETSHCEYSIQIDRKSAIISRSRTQRNQNAGVFNCKQKENHQKKKGVISFPFCECIHHSSPGKRVTAFKNTNTTWKKKFKKKKELKLAVNRKELMKVKHKLMYGRPRSLLIT